MKSRHSHGAELTPEQILASVPLPHAEAGAQAPCRSEDPHRRVRPLACCVLTLRHVHVASQVCNSHLQMVCSFSAQAEHKLSLL